MYELWLHIHDGKQMFSLFPLFRIKSRLWIIIYLGLNRCAWDTLALLRPHAYMYIQMLGVVYRHLPNMPSSSAAQLCWMAGCAPSRWTANPRAADTVSWPCNKLIRKVGIPSYCASWVWEVYAHSLYNESIPSQSRVRLLADLVGLVNRSNLYAGGTQVKLNPCHSEHGFLNCTSSAVSHIQLCSSCTHHALTSNMKVSTSSLISLIVRRLPCSSVQSNSISRNALYLPSFNSPCRSSILFLMT